MPGDTEGRHRGVRTRLSAMMFLFYFSLGAWVVSLSTYLMSAPIKGGLNFSTAEVGLIYSTFAFGGMLAPLSIGLLADRLFRAERVFGAASLISAGLLLAAGYWCDAEFPKMDAAYQDAMSASVSPDASSDSSDTVNNDPIVRRVAAGTFGPLFALMLGYCVCMQLANTLTTVIALRNVPDTARDFSRVRLFGTIGWIAAGFVIQVFFNPASSDVLYVAAVGSAVVGIYAFTLPATPPLGAGRSMFEALGLPALALFKDRSFVVFFAATFIATAMNQFYVVYAHRYLGDHGVPGPALVMTLAQVAEVGCMFALPFLRPRDWMKQLMLLGLAGYTLRSIVMAIGWVPAVLALGIPMHGWGYAFFFLVAATYLDREAPPHLRGSAQGIITFVAGGIGVLAGNSFAGEIIDRYRHGTNIDWTAVWIVPLIVCGMLTLAFAVLFKPSRPIDSERPG